MKKRNIMSIEIIAALLTALVVLVSSCATGGGSGIDNDDDSDIEETLTIENNDIETEVPDTSVDDGGEEDTTSQTWTTIKEIEEMKEHMIRLLNDNYDVFNRIVAYFEEEPEIIAFWEEDGEIVGRYEEGPRLPKIVDLSEVEVGEDIAFVIDELGFVGIVDNVIAISFIMVSNGIKTGGSTYNQELVCTKSTYYEYGNSKEWEEERENPDNPLGLMHIRDEWYYSGIDWSRNNF